jgi:hypothetical protein
MLSSSDRSMKIEYERLSDAKTPRSARVAQALKLKASLRSQLKRKRDDARPLESPSSTRRSLLLLPVVGYHNLSATE